MYKNLPDPISRHPSFSCLFSHLFNCEKELLMSFSLLTKACWFFIVQSTTTSTTTSSLCHCLHKVTYSLAVVPLGSYFNKATSRVMVTHTITLWVVTHRIIHTVSFCISVCILHITSICLIHLLGRAALSYTMYSLHSVP